MGWVCTNHLHCSSTMTNAARSGGTGPRLSPNPPKGCSHVAHAGRITVGSFVVVVSVGHSPSSWRSWFCSSCNLASA